jgi:hypothetical protein
VTGYRTCADCPAPVKFSDRVRCHACHRRATRAALKRPCPECGQGRHLGGSGVCASCARAAAPGRPQSTITCASCGQERRHASHGMCNRCMLADPDRPFRYAAALAGRLGQVPAWWDDLTAFAAARHHPGGAIEILREAGRLLAADPAASPPQLLDRCEPGTGAAGRALRRFFTSRGLALPGDEEQRRAARAAAWTPSRPAWPPQSPPSTTASSRSACGPCAPGGARSATPPCKPGSGPSATLPST